MRELYMEGSRSMLCRLFEVPRSTANYEPVSKPAPEIEKLKETIKAELVDCLDFGVRRMYFQLHCNVVRRLIRRAYAELGLLRPVKKRRTNTTDSSHEHPRYKNLVKSLEITRPNQVWVGDVTYLSIKSRWVYVAHLMDARTRKILGWSLSTSNDTALTLAAFEMAKVCGVPEIHHSDQGATYASHAYTQMLARHGVTISMAATGAPYDNGLAERWNRTLKEEEVRRHDYAGIAEAHRSIEAFVQRYNRRRIHSSLRYLTPQKVWETFISL